MGHPAANGHPNDDAPDVAGHVARLRARGFAVCKPDPSKKNPTYKRWGTRSLEPDNFRAGGQVGILGGPLSDGGRPGHALVIVDLDAADAVRRAADFLPATGMIDGRKGKPRSHRYYLIPFDTIPEWATSTADQGASAAVEAAGHAGPFLKHFAHAVTADGVLDFIGTGGQTVCPPSVHTSGEPREWVGGEPGEPAVVPFGELWDAVRDLAAACGAELPAGERVELPAPPALPPRAGNVLTYRVPTDESRAVAYLATIPGAVAERGGHRVTMWAARCVVWGFGLGADVGYRLLRDHYNPRCKPEWSERELWHKATEADKPNFDKARGWLRDAPPPDRAQVRVGSNGQARPAPAEPPPADDDPAPAEPATLTDVGNARRVVRRHGADLRYVYAWKQFLTWDGRRWAADATGAAVRMVKDTQADLYQWAAAAIAELAKLPDGDTRKDAIPGLTKVLNHALKWMDARRVAACLDMVRSEPGVPVEPADLDRDPFRLNCRNGTLDLRTGELLPHDRAELLTKLCPVEYDAAAACPTWLRFLDRIMDGNGDLVEYLQRVVGYALTGSVSEQCLFFLHGTGANGKSTFLGTVKDMLGDYGCQAVSELLMAKANDAHPAERADLFGRRFVATIETDDGKRMAEALMKQLTGGDAVKARRLYQDFFEIVPTWKLFLAANHKPTVRGCDHAVWRRIKLVPFAVTIDEAERDKDLPDKLRAEWPGVLAWAVRGCLDWQRDGLGEPEEVKAATDAYRCEQDLVAGFVAECGFVHGSAKCKATALYEAYAEWSGDRFTSQKAFGQRMGEMGFERKRGHGGTVFYLGIGLPAPAEVGQFGGRVRDGEG